MRLLLAIVVCALLVPPQRALACGGCFIPVPQGQLNQPVLQNAERILFAHDGATKTSTLWIEIRYDGPPGEFSWVLPLPKEPQVGVGDPWLFDRLDAATGARFKLDFDGSENCAQNATSSGGVGCGAASSALAGDAAPRSAENAGTALGVAGVTVLRHVQVGKYDAYTVKANATDPGAEAMVAWLTQNKYAVPAAAVPILNSHVKRGDVFLALKLQPEAQTKEIRPIVLKMAEAEACVPLRLTSIAAVEDMDVVVTLAGEGRAIPKNFMHVAINPARIDWFGAAKNYPQVLAAAIDAAAGRAFATEFAGKLPKSVPRITEFGGVTQEPTFDLTALHVDALTEMTEARAVWSRLQVQKLPITETTAEVLERHFKLAAGNDLVTFYSTLDALQINENKQLNGDALATELESAFCKPMREMATALAGAAKVTRLVLRISPAEMAIKDPVFAFSPTLPDVGNVTPARAHAVCRRGDSNADAERLTLPGLGSWVLESPGGARDVSKVVFTADPRFASAPPALRVEVLDEWGEPFAVSEGDVALVDAALSGAHAGKPSLDIKLNPGGARWTPPPTDPLYGTSAANSARGGCQEGRSPAPTSAALIAVLAAVVAVRRRRPE